MSSAIARIAQAPNADNAVPKRCGAISIRGRARLSPLAKQIAFPIPMPDDNIVVDNEIRVIVIFMSASDEDDPTIRQRGD